MLQIREEVYLTKGCIVGCGTLVSRGKANKADFVLSFKPNIRIAIVEVKDNLYNVGDGIFTAVASLVHSGRSTRSDA
jgi:type I restriction enzyme, R subunit